MSGVDSKQRPPMTFAQQAELLEYIIARVTPVDNKKGGWLTMTWLDEYQIEDLRLTAQRLRRMVPHESRIRRLVVGR